MWKGAKVKKTSKFTRDKIKKQVIKSMVANEVAESDELNKQAEKVQDPKEAAKVIQKYENIIRTKKKEIISIPYHQGKVFKKFKEKEKFIPLVSRLGIHKKLQHLKLMFLNFVKDILNC